MNIILATTNDNKVEEIKKRLNLVNLSYDVYSLSELSFNKEIIEFGTTLEQNALIKAQAIAKYYPNSIVIADDSGLEVNSLDKNPGVYSARYAEGDAGYEQNPDLANNEKLLRELKHKIHRDAKFRTIICVIKPHSEPIFVQGEVDGQILYQAVGDYGFGYDPLFSHDGLKTFAEMDLEEKNLISHRGKAFDELFKRGVL